MEERSLENSPAASWLSVIVWLGWSSWCVWHWTATGDDCRDSPEDAFGNGLEQDVVDVTERLPEIRLQRGHMELLLTRPNRDRQVKVVVDVHGLAVDTLRLFLLRSLRLQVVAERTNHLVGPLSLASGCDVRPL